MINSHLCEVEIHNKYEWWGGVFSGVTDSPEANPECTWVEYLICSLMYKYGRPIVREQTYVYQFGMNALDDSSYPVEDAYSVWKPNKRCDVKGLSIHARCFVGSLYYTYIYMIVHSRECICDICYDGYIIFIIYCVSIHTCLLSIFYIYFRHKLQIMCFTTNV